ncbi:hypothetical protein MT997_12425 [Paenibacillus sp. OVF10]|nr:hypothetical protein MT997_12425 [Paenibacillus sp. OVF10]
MGTETGRRHFIITGTSKGIGLQLAELLLAKGDYVYGISRGVRICWNQARNGAGVTAMFSMTLQT